MNWQEIELSGYTYYAEKGYRILVPLVSTRDYDFIAEKEGNFIRINVKTAGLKDKQEPNSWAISQASGGYQGQHNTDQVDIYLAWLPHQERFIELPGDFFNVGNSKCRRIPKIKLLDEGGVSRPPQHHERKREVIMRITEKDLKIRVARLNKLVGFDNPKYSTIGAYCLDSAYGGVQLQQYVNNHGAVRDIFRCGFVPKRELYHLIGAFMDGMEARQNT